MNELTTQTIQLPDTLPELAKFALVGREKLAAVRAEINAIKKVGLAKEVLEQKKAEAQEIAELVTLSEVRIGKMLKEIPKASGGDRRSEGFKNDTTVHFEKAKSEVLKEIGIPEKTAQRFQTMAEHEDIVLEAIEEAKRNDDIPSRSAVLKKIANEVTKPLREAKKKDIVDAKLRHTDFEEKKSENVVNFTDAVQDKQDVLVINEEYMRKINSALTALLGLGIGSKPDHKLDSLVGTIGDFEADTLANSIRIAEQSLARLRQAIERRKA